MDNGLKELNGQIAHKARRRPSRPGGAGPVERTNAWHNVFNRLQRFYEQREGVIDAFFDQTDAIITMRSLIRQGSTTYRRDGLGTAGSTSAVTIYLSARPLTGQLAGWPWRG